MFSCPLLKVHFMNPYLNALASRIDIFHVQMIDCPHQVILVGGAATYEMTCIKFVSEAAELFEVILRSKSAEFDYSTLILSLIHI